MATQPSLPDLLAAGVSTDDFITRLVAYTGPRNSPVWVVRWNGRIRAIQGLGFFNSRDAARSAVIKWLRDSGRWAFSGHHDIIRRLPRNWSYKKAYRTFIDQLVIFFEETGQLEYVELQAPAPGVTRPEDSPRTLIG